MPSLPFEKKQGSLPIWGDETIHMYGKFEGFPWISPQNSALFGLVSYHEP